MAIPTGARLTIDLTGDDSRGSSSISTGGPHVMMDLQAIQQIIQVHDEKAKQTPSAVRKFCLEFKSKGVENFEQEDIEEIRQHHRRVLAERAQEEKAKEDRKKGGTPKPKPVVRGPEVVRKVGGTPKPKANPVVRDPEGDRKVRVIPELVPDPNKLIATIALPESPGNAKFGWMVMEGQWLCSATVCTYRVPTEWKVTQLVGMEETKIAVLGRNGCGKTIVEVYNLMKPFEKLFEKVFTYGHKDVWQFGADGGGNNLILGCQNELGILDTGKRSYEAAQISRRVKGWGNRRVRALCCNGKKILIANDRDLTLQVFTMAFTVAGAITIQEHMDCIWSLAMYEDKILVCGGIAGEAFTMDWQGKMLFSFRPPEAQTVAIPAVVETDSDGFAHVFWMVKIGGSFRAVDFFYNIKVEKCFAEVRLDKKVKYMTSVKRPPPGKPVKTVNSRTVVMTDEGDLYVSDSIFENSRGL